MKKEIVSLSAALLLITGCTTLQLAAENKTTTPLVYAVRLDESDKDEFSRTVVSNASLPATAIGKYRNGTKVEVLVMLPRGGRVDRSVQTLPSNPDPFTVKMETTVLQGQYIDFGTAADIEKTITDVSGSFFPATNNVDNLLTASLGGVYFCVDNLRDAAHPKCDLRYGPNDLNSKVPANFYGAEQFPASFKVEMILDKDSAGRVSAEVPTVATVRADFNASEIYKYDMNLRNTGWRLSPVTWGAVQTELNKTERGRQIISDLRNTIATLKPGEHVYYLDRAYIVGTVDITNYQGQRLSATTDINASNYIALGAAYAMSNSKYDSKSGGNLVLRVDYSELHLFDAKMDALLPQQNGVALLEVLQKTRIVSAPARRSPRRY